MSLDGSPVPGFNQVFRKAVKRISSLQLGKVERQKKKSYIEADKIDVLLKTFSDLFRTVCSFI
jgi:hypothetical protein